MELRSGLVEKFLLLNPTENEVFIYLNLSMYVPAALKLHSYL